MFSRFRDPDGPVIRFEFEGQALEAAPGDSVAAALLANDVAVFRSTPVGGQKRGPYCLIGACFDCLVEIDGAENSQACQIEIREGMRIRRQQGKTGIEA